jgi:hypothetical protein
MKDEKRQQELEEFNKRLEAKPEENNLYSQFKRMDDGKKNLSAEEELEKRRQIYKNVRKELGKDEAAKKEEAYTQKMASLELKSNQKEQDRKQSALEEQERERTAASKQQESKNFLDNIKTYNVD